MTIRNHIMIKNWTSLSLVIEDVISRPGGASWADIQNATLDMGWTIHDWLTEVRGPLQALLNSGKIRRTRDVHREHYYAVEQWPK